jgi:DNA-binding NarL/FixJ family response regulator
MKKINITVACVGDEVYPGCVDLLAACPAINIVARPAGLNETGTWAALGQSDVLLLDEAVLEQDGHHTVRAIHDSYPLLRSLLILDNETQQEMLTVLSLGILGVIGRASMTSLLCKAVSAICAGEAWLSRELVPPLRRQLGQETGLVRLLEDVAVPSGRWKLH